MSSALRATQEAVSIIVGKRSGSVTSYPESNLSKRQKSTINQIVSTKAIEVLLNHREPGTWFVYDIDNVLAKTPTQYGSDQWFRWRWSHAKKTNEPAGKALNHWYAVQLMTDLEPVDAKTASVVKQLQQEEFPSLAITSRGITLASRTVQQLQAIDIDFSENPIHEEEKFWARGRTEGIDEHMLFEKGILFSSGQNKGTAIKKLFETFAKEPENIVFIDDHLHHVERVGQACRELGINFFGYHYQFLEDWVNAFDPSDAEGWSKAIE